MVVEVGYRHRRMYYLTGMPGWLRFGYSPGWVGRSPTGLPPTAQWIMSSGLMPQYLHYLGATAPSAAPTMVPPTVPTAPTGVPLTKEQEEQMLKQQAEAIGSQLDAMRKRLEELRTSPETQQPQQYAYPPMPYGYQSTPYITPPPEEELAALEDYRKNLDEEVKSVEARTEEVKKLIEQRKTEKFEEAD